MVKLRVSKAEPIPRGSAALPKASTDGELEPAIQANDFASYRLTILHDWLKTITILASTLVPLFYILDLFLVPSHLLVRFAVYRLASTALSLAQLLIVTKTRPGKWSYLHGYFASLQIGCMISLMTVSLGGFDSGYYAGLNLVIVGVNLLLPWNGFHTAANSLIVLALYLALNFAFPHRFTGALLVNNLYFLLAMAVVAVSINQVRFLLISKEFSLLVQLREARDALWGEMEVAKRIQTALLPKSMNLSGYEICATMVPADEVGGDYYDVLETKDGERWVAIGDVSGHGVDSGLVMMMAQTSIMTIIRENPLSSPSKVIVSANAVLRENIARLDTSHYVTLMLLKLGEQSICYAGKHQDLLVYRAATRSVELAPATGTWLGITDDLAPFLAEHELSIGENDAVLLFTDGVTELRDGESNLFGEERLAELFLRYAPLSVDQALDGLMNEIHSFPAAQEDDITLLLLKKVG
jgi:serine phosphatase RsbU (regulator of sigma subunit)